MTKHGSWLISALLAAVTTGGAEARAQSTTQGNAAAGAPVLQLSVVPRTAALGGAGTASEGIGGIFTNPAAAATVRHLGMQLAGQSLYDGAKAGSIAVGIRSAIAAFAVGAQYLDMGSVDELICDGCGGQGSSTGRKLSASEQAVSAAAAVSLARIASLGAAVHYYSTSLADQSGSAVSFSGGVRAQANEMIAVGASLQYLGGSAKVGGYSSALPRTARVGAELHPLAGRHVGGGSLQLALLGDYVSTTGSPSRVVGGLEVGVLQPSSLGLVGRVGVGSGSGSYATQALSFGGGLRYRELTLDYAYQGSDVFGSMHRLGVTFER